MAHLPRTTKSLRILVKTLSTFGVGVGNGTGYHNFYVKNGNRKWCLESMQINCANFTERQLESINLACISFSLLYNLFFFAFSFSWYCGIFPGVINITNDGNHRCQTIIIIITVARMNSVQTVAFQYNQKTLYLR